MIGYICSRCNNIFLITKNDRLVCNLCEKSDQLVSREIRQEELPKIIIDSNNGEVFSNNNKIGVLQTRDIKLVAFLAEHKGCVFSREELLNNVFGSDYFGDIRTIDVMVRHIREVLEPNRSMYNMIICSKQGIGYFIPEIWNIQVGDKEKLDKGVESSANDKFEEIKKYKELLDLNIITQEEFEIKKKELLSL